MLTEFTQFEPNSCARFILKFKGYNIPEWLVRSYRFYNDGDKLMMDVKIIEAIIFVINPTKLFDIDGMELSFLDATGYEYQKHVFGIKGMNFEHISDYGELKISTYNFVFEIDQPSFNVVDTKDIKEKNI